MDKLYAIGRQVRKWAEKSASTTYKKEGDVDPASLCGMCARSSAKTLQLLEKNGFTTFKWVMSDCEDYSHIYVKVKIDRHWWAIDCTATQFNDGFEDETFPEVAIFKCIPKVAHELPSFWRDITHSGNSLKSLSQFTKRWPKGQKVRA